MLITGSTEESWIWLLKRTISPTMASSPPEIFLKLTQAGWVTPTSSTIWAPSNFDTYTWADREVGFHPHAIYKSGERQFCAKFNRGTCTSAPFCFRTTNGVTHMLHHRCTVVVGLPGGATTLCGGAHPGKYHPQGGVSPWGRRSA